MRNTKNKRGFTIVEVVIAMAVVVVVSAVAITTIVATRKSEVQLLRDLDTVRFAENAFECFKGTTSEEEFIITLVDVEKDAYDGSFENGSYWFRSKKYDYVAKLTLESDQKTLSIAIDDGEGELLSFRYTKGGAE